MELSKELTSFLKEYSEYETNILKPTLNEIKECLKGMSKPEFWINTRQVLVLLRHHL